MVARALSAKADAICLPLSAPYPSDLAKSSTDWLALTFCCVTAFSAPLRPWPETSAATNTPIDSPTFLKPMARVPTAKATARIVSSRPPRTTLKACHTPASPMVCPSTVSTLPISASLLAAVSALPDIPLSASLKAGRKSEAASVPLATNLFNSFSVTPRPLAAMENAPGSASPSC